MTIRRRLRTLALAGAACLLLSGGLTACGSFEDLLEDDDGSTSVDILTRKQQKRALLTLKDLGPGFRKVPPKNDSGNDDFNGGCLDKMDDMDDLDGGDGSEIAFEHQSQLDLPAVNQAVITYRHGPAAVSDEVAEFRGLMKGCRKVQSVDDGVTLDLRVTTGAKKSAPSVDEQVNVRATGLIRGPGGNLPFGFWIAAIRIDNHVTLVSVGDVGTNPALFERVSKRAAQRLNRVARAMKSKGSPGTGESALGALPRTAPAA